MEDRQEILKALRTIQNVCTENKCCSTCPFEIGNGCIIQEQNPESWKIKETDTGKHLKIKIIKAKPY